MIDFGPLKSLGFNDSFFMHRDVDDRVTAGMIRSRPFEGYVFLVESNYLFDSSE